MTTSIDIKLGPWDEMADMFAWDDASGIRLVRTERAPEELEDDVPF